jgi:spore maturation protein B
MTVEWLRPAIDPFSYAMVPFLFVAIPVFAVARKVRLYEEFIEGAKGGFEMALRIIPYLVAILVAIGMFRASGALDLLAGWLAPLTERIGMPAETVPVALMRPLSGSGSLGLVTELIKVHGPDSFIGRLASTFYGSTETTFYVLAVYFGAVGIRRTRHAVVAGLLADAAGLLTAVWICRVMFS